MQYGRGPERAGGAGLIEYGMAVDEEHAAQTIRRERLKRLVDSAKNERAAAEKRLKLRPASDFIPDVEAED